jgi:hypothetical protein
MQMEVSVTANQPCLFYGKVVHGLCYTLASRFGDHKVKLIGLLSVYVLVWPSKLFLLASTCINYVIS